jgi:hypothetical protein
VISNVAVTADSFIIYKVIDGSDHTVEDATLEGLILNTGSINPGSGFTVYASAINNTWGIYNFKYTIFN